MAEPPVLPGPPAPDRARPRMTLPAFEEIRKAALASLDGAVASPRDLALMVLTVCEELEAVSMELAIVEGHRWECDCCGLISLTASPWESELWEMAPARPAETAAWDGWSPDPTYYCFECAIELRSEKSTTA